LLVSADVYEEHLGKLKVDSDAIETALSVSVQKMKVNIEREPECSFLNLFEKFNRPDSRYRGKVIIQGAKFAEV